MGAWVWVGRQLQGTPAYSVCLDNGLTRRPYSACIQQRGGTVPWKSILPARFRSRTLTGVGANSTARLISSTQQWEYLSTEYFVYFRVGKCIHCELVNVSTQKFVKILAVYFNHHLYHIFSDIFDFLKAFNEFDITMFT